MNSWSNWFSALIVNWSWGVPNILSRIPIRKAKFLPLPSWISTIRLSLQSLPLYNLNHIRRSINYIPPRVLPLLVSDKRRTMEQHFCRVRQRHAEQTIKNNSWFGGCFFLLQWRWWIEGPTDRGYAINRNNSLFLNWNMITRWAILIIHRLSLPRQTVSLLLVSQEANLSMTNGQTGRGGEAAPAYKIRLQPNSDPGTKI